MDKVGEDDEALLDLAYDWLKIRSVRGKDRTVRSKKSEAAAGVWFS